MILELKERLTNFLQDVVAESQFTLLKDKIVLEESRHPKYGLFNTNLPFILASLYRKTLEESERILAQKIPKHEYISRMEVTKGYINFFVSPEVIKDFYLSSLKVEKIIFAANAPENRSAKYFIEIISANPTGALHIGHIRNGVITDTISNLLEYNGNSVYRSYLVNDGGTQIKELIASIHNMHSYLAKASPLDLSISQCKYTDENVRDCARSIGEHFGYYWELQNREITSEITTYSVDFFLKLIKKEVEELKIKIDSWDYESKLCSEGALTSLISKIKDHIYLEDNALWFRTEAFDPDLGKNDVIVKGDGALTYFGQDLIYHLYKLEFLGKNGTVVNTLAADHKGHIGRMRAFFKCLRVPQEVVRYKLTQLSRLVVNGKKVIFSKRENIYLTLAELKQYLSIDEIRWFLSSRDEESELDIEIDKLRNKDYNNPIFYILYAYSRASKLSELLKLEISPEELNFEALNSDTELELIQTILYSQSKFSKAVETLKPNILSAYLYSLAQKFHSFYDSFSISYDYNPTTKLARLALVQLVARLFEELLPIFKIAPRQLS
ncbi:arginine--tRNA ligase [Candidatus Mycoplasma haematominutum]|uniref:Arginine--tRNA ligase n=1 Tax=Candidatus Mycoplasma haematominutum 'Birmingham 1' TaxID=1116213 RepID=G8C3B7_9MOLU|nr:arginine--tRNA ligase [Candidatus Mycoplasma haematominutum]CCE66815.1 arginyl-tRNA synthetase [Candidatus Mycoplasma haematominutum 'Birmingham 1']